MRARAKRETRRVLVAMLGQELGQQEAEGGGARIKNEKVKKRLKNKNYKIIKFFIFKN